MKRVGLYILISACAVWFVGCGGGNTDDRKGKPGNLPLVAVHYAKNEPIAERAKVTGEVVATQLARLASPAEGPILTCKVREGDRVQQGELLVSIGKTKASDASLAAAEVELRRQEEDYKRVERLVSEGALPAEQLDEAGAERARARAEQARAMEESENYRISSPWDGVVSKVMVTEGDYVSPQSSLIELYDPDSLVVRFAVPEVLTSRVRAGTECEVTLDAYPDRIFSTRVERVFGELNRDTRMLNVEIKMPDSVMLMPGMFARITVLLNVVPDAVVIPVGAVLTSPEGDSIVFAVKDNTAALRKVKTGLEEGNRVQILEGVEAGEAVVVAGNERLKNGMRVRIRDEKKGAETPPKPGKESTG